MRLFSVTQYWVTNIVLVILSIPFIIISIIPKLLRLGLIMIIKQVIRICSPQIHTLPKRRLFIYKGECV